MALRIFDYIISNLRMISGSRNEKEVEVVCRRLI
jgi:hypothetical protein